MVLSCLLHVTCAVFQFGKYSLYIYDVSALEMLSFVVVNLCQNMRKQDSLGVINVLKNR